MSKHVYDVGSMVIASSETDSTAIAADPHYQNATALIIEGPDALTGTVTVEVSLDDASSYSKLQSGGADITIGAGDAVPITFQAWTHIRVSSGSAEDAERTFVVKAVEDVGLLY